MKELENYFLKDNKIFRKQFFSEKSKRMYYEKELKIQKVKGYQYVTIAGKLQNIDKIKLMLKSK